MKNIKFTITFIIVIFILGLKPAYAYFDPGTGSIILQYLAIGLAFVASGISFFWLKIKKYYNQMKIKIKNLSKKSE